MDFRQLEAYILAYEKRSFSKAAESLFLSQPSISAYINALEKELKVQLLHRTNKEFMPTKAGRMLYEQAKEMVLLRDKSLQRMKLLEGDKAGNIDILASSVVADYMLPQLLADYHKQTPAVSFSVVRASSQEVIDGIIAGRADIGFAGTFQSSARCVFEPFATERLVLITPRTNEYDNRDAVALLKSEYFIMREMGSGTRQEYEEYLRCAGIKPSELKICAVMNNTQSIIQAVASGLGISIVSMQGAKQYSSMIKMIEINANPRKLYIISKGEAVLPIVAAFLSFVKARTKTEQHS